MKALAVLLFCIGLICLAQAQIPMTGAGKGAPGVVAYVGPGTVVSGAKAWWGSSGYTASDTGNAWNVCNVSDVVCNDWAIGANGYVTPALVGGSDCGVVTCTIKTIYDRSGALACGAGVSCDVTQATIANRATVVLNSLGTFACASISAGSGHGYVSVAAISSTLSQPYTMLAVSKRTGNFTTTGSYYGSSGASAGYLNSTSTVFGFASAVVSTSATDSAFHSVQTIFSTPTSAFYIDGTSTSTGDPGGTGLTGSLNLMWDGANPMTGTLCDFGFWGGAFSAPNQSSMNSNRHAAYGGW